MKLWWKRAHIPIRKDNEKSQQIHLVEIPYSSLKRSVVMYLSNLIVLS